MQERMLASQVPVGSLCDARQPTLTERLESEKRQLEERLEKVTSVLESLRAHPETTEILDSIAGLGHLNY